MMKANGINPNGGPATPEDESPEKPASASKKSQKTPTKGKSGDTPKSETPKKRRSGKGAATTPTKKVKSEEKVSDSDSDEANGGGNIHIKKEDGLNSEEDPFLTSQAPAKVEEDDDSLFNQFCNAEAVSAHNEDMA